jgi:hypothetical protein
MFKNIYPTTLFFNFVFLHETFHGFMALLLPEKISTTDRSCLEEVCSSNLYSFFFCAGVVYSGEYNVCDVIL